MKGIIGIDNLKINCFIGILPRERVVKQTIWVDLKVQFDLTHCIKSHSFALTLDYVQLAKISRSIAKKKHELLEIYAYEVLEKIFLEFSVGWAWIKVKKPQAIPSAEFAFVELEKGSKT